MIKYFNSMKEGNKYSLNKGAVVAGVLAATIMITVGCNDKNSKESEQATNHVDKITEIGSMAIDAAAVVSEKILNVGQHLTEFDHVTGHSIEVYNNVAVLRVLSGGNWKTNIIDMNSNECISVDSICYYDTSGVEFITALENQKKTIIDPNSEKPLNDLVFKYDYAGIPELIGDDLVSAAWNYKESEEGFQMDFALLNYTTGETLIPEGTYDYISVETVLNGVHVYEGKNYPTDFVSFKELGLSQNTKTKSLN